MASTSAALEVLAPTITCHTWNGDRTKVAISPNNNEIHIYQVNGDNVANWRLEHVLKEHDQTITGLDWAPNTNRILSCAQDRNAYVWTYTLDAGGNYWKPTLVLLRINRAATCCKWSPSERKFAVGSGAKVVSICYFEEANNWWVSKMLKKHKSTVLSLAWHPTDTTLIATGASDFKCRVFSCYIKDVDVKPAQRPPKFGEVVAEYTSKSWVHSVAWSPSGAKISFLGHDSTLYAADYPGQAQAFPYRDLPAVSHFFANDSTIIAGGYDFAPLVFSTRDGSQWVYNGKCDKATESKKTTGFSTALNKFSTTAKLGEKNAAESSSLTTRHRNAITVVAPFAGEGRVTVFTSSALDGQLLFWDVKRDVEPQVEGVSF